MMAAWFSERWYPPTISHRVTTQKATVSTNWAVETWKHVRILFQLRICQHILSRAVCVYCSRWESVNTFSLEACAYIIPAENLSTHFLWRRVRILFQMRICQHILSGGVSVYCSRWESVNTFSLEACAYIIPAENLSTHSVERRVRILFQMRIWQHILCGGVRVYYSSWESGNTFSVEACAYIIPAENLSTHSLESRVRILFQMRICQHILSRGVCTYNSSWESVNTFSRETSVKINSSVTDDHWFIFLGRDELSSQTSL
jgi:hypothetical protein